MVGAVIAGTFFAIAFVIALILAYLIKVLKVKCLYEAYKMYLLEKGYEQPTKQELEEYYNKAVKTIGK